MSREVKNLNYNNARTMKKVITTVALLLLTANIAVVAQRPPKAPEGMKWEIVSELTDEFDDWDGKKWAQL